MSIVSIIRRPLLNVSLGPKTVTSVDVREIIFAPGQETGETQASMSRGGIYRRRCSCIRSRRREAAEVAGCSSFYEPAERVILRFDNASSNAPMKFIAHYLLNGNQELIEMLPENKS